MAQVDRSLYDIRRSGFISASDSESHKERLIAKDEWFWSTRADISSFSMYRFYYAEQILADQLMNTAVSHSGHGFNSYSINATIIKGPLAVVFLDSWVAYRAGP